MLKNEETKKETSKENGSWIQPRAALITGIILAAAALRIIPHPLTIENFVQVLWNPKFGGYLWNRLIWRSPVQAARSASQRPPLMLSRAFGFGGRVSCFSQ